MIVAYYCGLYACMYGMYVGFVPVFIASSALTGGGAVDQRDWFVSAFFEITHCFCKCWP